MSFPSDEHCMAGISPTVGDLPSFTDAATPPSAVNVEPTDTNLVFELNPNDVLFGRGAPSCYYIGNLYFREELIRPKKDAFMGTGRHDIKKQIADEIYAVIAAKNGRFLRRIKSRAFTKSLGKAEAFAVVSKNDALRKIKQALREFNSKENKVKQRRGSSIEKCANKTVARDSEQRQDVEQLGVAHSNSPTMGVQSSYLGVNAELESPTSFASSPLPSNIITARAQLLAEQEAQREHYHSLLLATREARKEALRQQWAASALSSHQAQLEYRRNLLSAAVANAADISAGPATQATDPFLAMNMSPTQPLGFAPCVMIRCSQADVDPSFPLQPLMRYGSQTM